MKILGLSGKSGSGKDTAGVLIKDALERTGYRCIHLSFATPLKEVCSLMFNWDYARLRDDNLYKESDTLDDGTPDPACEMLGMTRRVVMQKVGTECFREGLHPETWIIAMKIAIMRGDYSGYDFGILTDCRFINELQFVHDMGGELYKIKRIGNETLTKHTQHKSELEWETWTKWDGIIENRINPNLSDEANKKIFKINLINDTGIKDLIADHNEIKRLARDLVVQLNEEDIRPY